MVDGHDFESSHRYRGQIILEFSCIAKGFIIANPKIPNIIIFEEKNKQKTPHYNLKIGYMNANKLEHDDLIDKSPCAI